jgi:hypothetical protein
LFPIFSALAQHAGLRVHDYAYLTRQPAGSGSGSASGSARPKSTGSGLSSPKAAQVRPWSEVAEAMMALGLDAATCAEVQATVLGLVELGNIQFADVPPGEDEDVWKAKQEALERAMGDSGKPVLGVKLGELRNALKIKTLRVKNETFEKERTTREKYAARDGLARVIYASLFDWVISRVNSEVSRIDDVVAEATKGARASLGKALKRVSLSAMGRTGGADVESKGTIGIIGVLENAALVHKESTLEDLYQNYRLERFQSYMARDVVQRNAARLVDGSRLSTQQAVGTPPSEQVLELYMGSVHTKYLALAEAAEQAKAGASANAGAGAPPLPPPEKAKAGVAARYQDKVAKRASGRGSAATAGSGGGSPLGLLQLIEEEINLPGGSDKSLARRVQRKAAANVRLVGATTTDFTIAHFGGKITYSLGGLVDRSRANLIPLQVLKLLREKSALALVRQVVTFKRDPIGQSGVMAKREIESMLELDSKALEEAAAAAAAAAAAEDPAAAAAAQQGRALEYDPNEHRGKDALAKRIFNEMNRAVTILGRTQVEYIISLAANAEQDPKRRLDPQYLLDQIRHVGLSDAVGQRLYSSLRGTGTPQDDFLRRYKSLRALVMPGVAEMLGGKPTEPSSAAAPVTVPAPAPAPAPPPSEPPGKGKAKGAKPTAAAAPAAPPAAAPSHSAKSKASSPAAAQQAKLTASALCEGLAKINVVQGQWAVNDANRVFVTAKSYFALETARALVLDEAVIRIQRAYRRRLARLRRKNAGGRRR